MAGWLDRLKGWFSARGPADAGAGAAADAPHVDFAVVSRKIGLPEERIAQMAQMIRQNGMQDGQMGQMMALATSRGVTREEIVGMLGSMGVQKSQIVRVMQMQGLMEPDEAAAILDEERRAAEARIADERADKRRCWVKKALIIAFWLVVWQLLDVIVDNRLILAGPIRVAQALAEQIVEPDFLLIIGASFGRIALGFLLSFLVGLVLAMLAYRFHLFRDFIDPLISLLRTVPVASFIILLLIWVGNQALTVFLAFFIVLPIIYTNMLTGLENVDPQLLEVARVYRLSKWRTLWYVYRPAFMPFLVSATKLSLGMTWKSGIMAELIATPKPSIGKEMFSARLFLDTPILLAWTVVVMVLSVLFEQLFMALLRRLDRPMGGRLGKEG